MKTIPRIGGTWWPVFLALVLVLFLPMGVGAQEAEEAPDDERAGGEVTEEADVGEESVAGEEGDVVFELPDGTEILDLPVEEVPADDFVFQKPENFRIEDRRADEGGVLALRWSPSPTDGEEEAGGQYMVFHSEKGTDGPWELEDVFDSNTRYIWEEPGYFGFFLSDRYHGSNEHYSFFSNTYPARGVYEYAIYQDTEIEGNILVQASIYDEDMTEAEYAALTVYCNLKPFGGDKAELRYVPPDDPEAVEPWDNHYEASIPFDTSELPEITKYILFTSNVRGNAKGVLEAQPVKNASGDIVINTSGGETPVPDNRDPHWFRVYAAPLGYVLPEGTELPPDAWLIGATEGAVASGNLWNTPRTNTWLFAIFICISVLTFIHRARGGATLFVRRIAGLDHVEEAIGRATEMGRPILYSTGLGFVSDIATIASMNILGQVARKVADYDSRILVPAYDPIVMSVCQEVVQGAYIDAGRPDAYNKDDVFFLTSDQFAYTAAVNGIMMREKPATNFFMGMFYAESLLLAETGASTGAIQIAGTDALAQLPFFITACDYTLIGEELYAASAYLSNEPLLLGSLKGQDLAKMIFMISILIGTIWFCFAFIHLPNPEFFKQLFQVF